MFTLSPAPHATYRFTTDQGGIYEIRDYGTPADHTGLEAAVVITGLRTNTTYVSEWNDLRVTGKVRRQTGLGMGRRARVTLDTGEEHTTLTGVVQGALVY